MIASSELTDQAEPFQCSISVPCSRRAGIANPTAHASVAPLALTALSAPYWPRLGVGVSDHDVPSQWYAAAGACGCPAATNCCPTAQASLFVRADAPSSTTLFPVEGTETVVQPVAAYAAMAMAPTALNARA